MPSWQRRTRYVLVFAMVTEPKYSRLVCVPSAILNYPLATLQICRFVDEEKHCL